MVNDALHLDDPLLEDDLKTPYYFNGRLLTREDLGQEQTAQRAQRMQLGRALGSGIAYGLEVVADVPASLPGRVELDVAAGLAVAPDGTTLHLPELVRLRFFVRPERLDGVWASDDFADCKPSTATVSVVETGLHLLVLRPVAGKQGLAAVSGLGNEAALCNTKYRTSGVSFRALPLGVTSVVKGDPLFRSKVALECFGFFDEALTRALSDPLTGPSPLEIAVRPAPGAEPAPGYGKIDLLRQKHELASCEVPLAVIHLDDQGVLDFVDTWPVRRSLVRQPLTRRFWPFGSGDDRRRAEAEAAMLHFQDHVAAIPAGAALANAPANSHFAFLPGGGFLPVGIGRFDAAAFLGPGAVAVVDADFGRLRCLVEESWRCDPIDLSAPMPPVTYFVFAEAAARWVFFLRRRTENALPEPEEPEPGSPPSGPGPIDPKPKADAGIVVVVTEKWLKQLTNPRVVLMNAKGTEIDIEPINEAEANALLAKSIRFERPGFPGFPGPKRPKKQPTDAFPRARFFAALNLKPGAYWVAIEPHKMSLQKVFLDPGRVHPVVLN